jgi:hypothetical protein
VFATDGGGTRRFLTGVAPCAAKVQSDSNTAICTRALRVSGRRRGVSLDSLVGAEGLDSLSQVMIVILRAHSSSRACPGDEYVSGRVAACRICNGCDGVPPVDT